MIIASFRRRRLQPAEPSSRRSGPCLGFLLGSRFGSRFGSHWTALAQAVRTAVPTLSFFSAAARGRVTATFLCLLLLAPWGAVLAAAQVGGSGAGQTRPAGLATAAESLQVLPGFKVEMVRSSQGGEGSWVSLTTDPQGRLILSPQDKQPMLRLTIGADGKMAKMETIDLPVTGAMGLLHAFGGLYVNGAGPDGYHLYKLTDTDGDDRYDTVQLVHKWKGGAGEHGAAPQESGPPKPGLPSEAPAMGEHSR